MTFDSPQTCRSERIEGVTVITSTLGQISPEMRDELYALSAKLVDDPPPRRVVLNLGSVRTLNSSAIGILINFQRKVRDAAGALKICGLDPYVLDLFRLTKMDQVLELRGTQQEAIDAFQGRGRVATGEEKKGWFGRLFGK